MGTVRTRGVRDSHGIVSGLQRVGIGARNVLNQHRAIDSSNRLRVDLEPL